MEVTSRKCQDTVDEKMKGTLHRRDKQTCCADDITLRLFVIPAMTQEMIDVWEEETSIAHVMHLHAMNSNDRPRMYGGRMQRDIDSRQHYHPTNVVVALDQVDELLICSKVDTM